MTPDRFRNCLVFLRWSQLELAAILKCDVFLVHAWANGIDSVPDDISTWLNTLAKAHQRAGIPSAYEGRYFKMRVGRESPISH